MDIITAKQIEDLNISPATCVEWVRESFMRKYDSQCPAKMSVHPRGNDFITTMPALLPNETSTFGVKVVSRVNGRHQSLRSDLLLFDTESGEIKALVDANWITAMRTGAVAALTMKTLRKHGASHISMVGLGSTAHATMQCIAETFKDEHLHVKLMKYKEQAERFAQDFGHCANVSFEIVDNINDFMHGAEVVISCITDAEGLLVEDDSLFDEGVLVIPVHTRGFQNCDLFFDKVYADDTDHVRKFKYFDKFKQFDEFSNILLGNNKGRENDSERILAYNIGLGMHDAWYAHNIYNLLKTSSLLPPEYVLTSWLLAA